MSSKQEKQTIIDRIWSLFASIKLAVIVFSVISLTSIVGTIIEQQAEPERNLKVLSKLIGESIAPTALKILDATGFTDMFHSWWFITLLFVFAANLIICSIERLPRILKIVREPIKPLSSEQFDVMQIKRDLIIKERADKAHETVASALGKIGFKANIHNEKSGFQIYAEKGRYSRLGAYITHFSILLILIGAIVGIKFGFNGHLNLLEGTSSSIAYSGGSKEISLGFEIRCDDFEVTFYEGTDTPKSYKSWLTVLENGKPVEINGAKMQEIEVNTPLRYKGVTFYQSSYGFSPNRDSLFKFAITSKQGKREEVQLKFGESFTIPGTNITGKVVDFTPALGIDEKGRLFTYSEMMNNPAVFVEFAENGKPKYKQWILKRYPQTWALPDGAVEFKDLWGAQYTGLQVRKDPGVWIVYLGCIIMSIGLYTVFFMSYSRIWIRLKEEKNNTKLIVAASTNRNRISFEQKIDRLMSQLKGK